jgi:hypothetical protein
MSGLYRYRYLMRFQSRHTAPGDPTPHLIEPEQLHGALRYLGWVFEAGFSDL